MPTQGPVNPGAKLDRSLRDLFRATAVHCRGKTVVLSRGQGEGHLAKVISGKARVTLPPDPGEKPDCGPGEGETSHVPDGYEG